jgi:hypothetical protein
MPQVEEMEPAAQNSTNKPPYKFSQQIIEDRRNKKHSSPKLNEKKGEAEHDPFPFRPLRLRGIIYHPFIEQSPRHISKPLL